MKQKLFDNDDAIHRQKGSFPDEACPVTSPPELQVTHHQKMRGFLRKIVGMSKPSTPLFQKNVSYNIIVAPRFINYNSITNNKNMGFINNFNNYGIMVGHVDNFYNGTAEKREEQEAAETSEEDKDAKVSAVQPITPSDASNNQPIRNRKVVKPSFIDCIADRKTAHILMSWLHLMMDNKEKPKEKLIFLRAVTEAGHFSQTPDHKIYMSEFGPIARSSYYDWMKGSLRYNPSEINNLIEQYSIYLTKFPK